MALSETGPSQGTLKVFPDVHLSNAYIILRPFFRSVATNDQNPFDPQSWEFGERETLLLTAHVLPLDRYIIFRFPWDISPRWWIHWATTYAGNASSFDA